MSTRPALACLRALAAGLALGLGLVLATGCTSTVPRPGQSAAEVQAAWGSPTGRHALPGGGQRLEYATGPMGRHTWMVDTDAAGRVLQARQVLQETSFLAFQTVHAATPGLEAAAVRRELGRPGLVVRLGWQRGEVWTWRYPNNDCLVFEVGFDAAGRVTGSGYAIERGCADDAGLN